MTSAAYETSAQTRLSASEHSRQLRKAVIASTIGTTIEWYDFFIYGTAAGLIFGKLYFPNEDPLTGTLAAFGTYFIGFASRPVGAAIFGHYGDRIGRKATLIATLLLMDRCRGGSDRYPFPANTPRRTPRCCYAIAERDQRRSPDPVGTDTAAARRARDHDADR